MDYLATCATGLAKMRFYLFGRLFDLTFASYIANM